MQLTKEWRTELEGISERFKELSDGLLSLYRFTEAALVADELPDNWFDEYEQKLHWFMIEFAAKFAEAPNASSETTGSRTEIREDHQGSNSQATEDEASAQADQSTEEEVDE